MNTHTEPGYSNEDIIVILGKIEKQTKKVEKKINQLSWQIVLVPIAFAFGFWLASLW